MKKNLFAYTDTTEVKELIERLSQRPDLDFFNHFTQFKYAKNSLLAIQNDWNRYLDFCNQAKITILPCSIVAMRRFIETEARERKYSSIRRSCVHIGLIHQLLSLANPTSHRTIQLSLNELRLKKGSSPVQANAFTKEHLALLHSTLLKSKNNKEIRDCAIYSIMFECAAKRSELKALRMESVRKIGGTVSITIGDSAYQLSELSSLACKRWLERLPADAHYLFAAIDKHGNLSSSQLDDSSIFRIMQNAGKRLGLDETFSGQSGRIGAVEQLRTQGMKIREIQDFGRWLSPAMPYQYAGRQGMAQQEMLKFKIIKPWD